MTILRRVNTSSFHILWDTIAVCAGLVGHAKGTKLLGQMVDTGLTS